MKKLGLASNLYQKEYNMNDAEVGACPQIVSKRIYHK